MKMLKKGVEKIDIGANPSTEEGAEDEAAADDEWTVLDVVDAFRLNETSFDKKSYLSTVKTYMKRLKSTLEEKNPARVAIFQEKAQKFVMSVLEKFDQYTFYVGESFDPEGMVILVRTRDDGVTQYATFFKDGLRGEKF